MLDVGNHNSIDALLPPEMAERAEQIGVQKTRLDTLSLIALAVLAGAFVAFGSMFSLWPALRATCLTVSHAF
jgi:formate transporter